MNERRSNRRIRLLLGVFALVFAGTLGRAVWLQGVQASTLEQMASRQHQATTEIPAGRGTIFDRTGEPLAIGEQATTIYADPRSVKQPRRVALAAAKALGLNAETLYPLLADHSRHFVYVKRKADPAKAAELEKLKLPGLGFYAEELRYYPQRSVAAHVLGYAGIDNKGLEGLERSLDKSLIGKPGTETTVTDPAGRLIDVISTKPERAGDDVFLTIDHRIQANAEQVLRETVTKWGAKGGTAIVLDPRNGDVLAMAVAPGFNANAFGSASADRRRNRAVTDVYEPGSTFKVVTVAAALSEKLVTPTTAFTLPSSIRVADRIIHEHEPRPTQRMTVAQIVSQSSNIGTITLAQMLGQSHLQSWINRFGFGKSTGVDAPGESRGLLPSYWSGSTIGNVPIGQGIGVTPIQMATAYAAIANGGVMRVPHLVERIGDRAGDPQPGSPCHLQDRVRADDGDAPRRRLRRGRHRRGGEGARLHGRRQDRHRGEAGARGLLDLALRGLLRRRRARQEPAPRRARPDRRAARSDLGRRRRGACFRRDRALEPRPARDRTGR